MDKKDFYARTGFFATSEEWREICADFQKCRDCMVTFEDWLWMWKGENVRKFELNANGEVRSTIIGGLKPVYGNCVKCN